MNHDRELILEIPDNLAARIIYYTSFVARESCVGLKPEIVLDLIVKGLESQAKSHDDRMGIVDETVTIDRERIECYFLKVERHLNSIKRMEMRRKIYLIELEIKQIKLELFGKNQPCRSYHKLERILSSIVDELSIIERDYHDCNYD